MKPEDAQNRKDNCINDAAPIPDYRMQAPSIGGMALPDATETDLIGWDAIEEPREQRDHQRA